MLLRYRSVYRSSAARLRLHTQAQGSPASCTPTTLTAPRLARVQAAASDAEAKRPIRLQLVYAGFLAVVTWLSISMLPGGVLAAEPVDAVGHGLARGRRGGCSAPRTPRRPAHAHRPARSDRAACTQLQVSGRSAAHVWWYGWVTALSTGLGALPMIWYKNVSDYWLGVGNATAAGMMTAASVALLSEGLDLPGAPRYGVACGVLSGVVFILGSQRIMEP